MKPMTMVVELRAAADARIPFHYTLPVTIRLLYCSCNFVTIITFVRITLVVIVIIIPITVAITIVSHHNIPSFLLFILTYADAATDNIVAIVVL